MLRAGAVLLTVWAAMHLVIALGILVSIIELGKNAPALMILFGDTQASGADVRTLSDD
jgi:hypothetical protein